MTKLIINMEKSTLNTGRLVKKKVAVKGKNGKVHMAFRYVNPNKESGQDIQNTPEVSDESTSGTDTNELKPVSLFEGENQRETVEKVESQTQSEIRDVVYETLSESSPQGKTPPEVETTLNDVLEDFDPVMKTYDDISGYVSNPNTEGRYTTRNKPLPSVDTGLTMIEKGDILDMINHYNLPPQLGACLSTLSTLTKVTANKGDTKEYTRSIQHNAYQVLKAFGDNFSHTQRAVLETMEETFGDTPANPVYKMSETDWSNKIKRQCFDTQLGSNTSDYNLKIFNVLGSHPGVCSLAVDLILGSQTARELRGTMRGACVSITMPQKVSESVLKEGYRIKSGSDFVAENIILNEDDTMELSDYKRYTSGDTSGFDEDQLDILKDIHTFMTDVADEEYFSLIGSSKQNGRKLYEELEGKASDHGFTLDSYSAQTRYEAERDTSGVYFSDYKPCYLFFNPTGNSNGLELYGDHTIRVSNSVLKQCTCVSDDSFVDTSTVPSVYGMNHLKDLYLLKNIMSHPDRLSDGTWSEINNQGYEIPLELQYHSKTEKISPELLSSL